MNEKFPNRRQQIWDKYLTGHFSYCNKLDQQQYERAAKSYDRAYSELLPADKNTEILDIGCGSGHFLFYLKQKGYTNFWGIDISQEQVEFVRQTITEKVEVADLFDFLKEKRAKYDLIIANDLVEHIPKDRTLSLMNLIYSALKDKGRVVLKTPNMSAPFMLQSRYHDFTHEIGFTEHSLAQVLRVADFQGVEVIPLPYGKGVAILFFGVRLLYRLFRGKAPQCLTVNIIGVGIKS